MKNSKIKDIYERRKFENQSTYLSIALSISLFPLFSEKEVLLMSTTVSIWKGDCGTKLWWTGRVRDSTLLPPDMHTSLNILSQYFYDLERLQRICVWHIFCLSRLPLQKTKKKTARMEPSNRQLDRMRHLEQLV